MVAKVLLCVYLLPGCAALPVCWTTCEMWGSTQMKQSQPSCETDRFCPPYASC